MSWIILVALMNLGAAQTKVSDLAYGIYYKELLAPVACTTDADCCNKNPELCLEGTM